MFKKKMILLIAAVSVVFLLCGCNLADPDAGSRGPDQLIGGYVTTKNLSGEEYGEKIYAEVEKKKDEIIRIEFKDVEGWGIYLLQKGKGDNLTNYSLKDEHMLDEYLSTGTECSISGTLYYTKTEERTSFYITPVYETADGRIYMTAESSAVGSTDSNIGDTLTLSIHNKIDRHMGKRVINNMDMRVTTYFKSIYNSEKVVIKQFDEGGRLLQTDVPDMEKEISSIAKAPGMAYSLIETHHGQGVSRKVYEEGEELEYFYCGENGIAIRHTVEIV